MSDPIPLPPRATIDISTPRTIKKALRAHYELGYTARLADQEMCIRSRTQALWDNVIEPIIGEFFLQPRQLEILKCRYILGMTFDEIARKHDVSRERVRQIEANFLQRIKDMPRLWMERGRMAPPVDLEGDSDIDGNKKYTPIEILNLSPRTLNALINAGVGSIEQLCQCTASILYSFRGFGSKAIDELTTCLYARGLTLKSDAAKADDVLLRQ